MSRSFFVHLLPLALPLLHTRFCSHLVIADVVAVIATAVLFI